MEENGEMIWKIWTKIVKLFGKYGRKASRLVKRYETYGRKVGISEMIWKIWKKSKLNSGKI